MLWAATWWGEVLGGGRDNGSLGLGLGRLLRLLRGRRQECMLGLMLVVGHPIGHHPIMLRLLVLLVVMGWLTVGMEVLL